MNKTQLTIESSAPTAQPAWARTDLPINSVERCKEAAAPMFADSAVVSVNIQASFGIVEVRRDGTCWLQQAE